MAKPSKLRVMISSRCDDEFPAGSTGKTLSEIRKNLKAEVEALEVFGKNIFEVWINEDAPPASGTEDSWEHCLNQVKDCDILLAVSNGNAGWSKNKGDIGICHAELMEGLSQAPGKVRIIVLDYSNKNMRDQDQRFHDYVNSQSLFRGGSVGTEGTLKTRVKEALYDVLLTLAQAGTREASKGNFHKGHALDWSRLDFSTRRREMRSVLLEAMLQRNGSKDDGHGHAIVKFANLETVVIPDAIPAAFSVGAAKEMVGQPFLYDYKLSEHLKGKRGGPVHIIGCHKNATESQAVKLLGFPDATVVSAPFGIFVADKIHKVQFAFIANCRDETTTRHGVQRFFEWLEQTGEERLVAERAKSRANIVSAIARETGNNY